MRAAEDKQAPAARRERLFHARKVDLVPAVPLDQRVFHDHASVGEDRFAEWIVNRRLNQNAVPFARERADTGANAVQGILGGLCAVTL